MMRGTLLLCLWAVYLCAANGQPVGCAVEEQCPEEHYCDTEAHLCRQCLNCNDLKREPPLTSSACITSVAECGACFKGLVVDRRGDLNAACVPVTEEAVGTPNYVWWLIGVGILVFVALMLGIIVYVWINPGIFENFKLRGHCESGTVSTNITTESRPSAPEAPPPYTPRSAAYNSIPYSSVRARSESPCPPHHEAGDVSDVHEEEGPFIKRSSQLWPNGAREAAGSQAARVYDPPIYLRQEIPSSPEGPIVTELNDNLPHDEETMESIWTPSGTTNGDINANNNEMSTSAVAAPVDMSAALAASRDVTLIEHTPPKQMRLQTNVSRNHDSGAGGDGTQGNFSGTQSGSPYNFITHITNVVQFNRNT